MSKSNKEEIEFLEQSEFANMFLDILDQEENYILEYKHILSTYLELTNHFMSFVSFIKKSFQERIIFTKLDLVQTIITLLNELDVDFVRQYSILGVSLYNYFQHIRLYADTLEQLHLVINEDLEHDPNIDFKGLIEAFDDTIYVLKHRITLFEEYLPLLDKKEARQ